MSVHSKLIQARIKLQSTELKKSGFNKFAGYYYFCLGDFIPQVQQIFYDLGLCGVISYATDAATLTITDIDDGQEIKISSPMSTAALKGCHDVQNLGAVETYIRRYLWVTAMEIVEHEVIDETTKEADQPDKKIRLPKLGDEEAQAAYESWTASKLEMVDEDGVVDNDKIIEAWGKMPSNVRSAIKRYGEMIATQNETDQQAKSHMENI